MSATVLLSVLAASLAVPQPSSGFASAAEAARDAGGSAVVRLFVAPDRTVEDCKVIGSELSTGDAERVCNYLRGKRAAKAASGPDGQAAYGTLLYVVAGSVDGFTAPVSLHPNLPPDVVLNVQSLPNSERSKLVSVNLWLDPSGKVVGCEPAQLDSAAFTKAACASLDRQMLEARHDRDGKAVSYVDNVVVGFLTEKAG